VCTGDDVDDEVVDVNKRVKTVEHGEGVLDYDVATSYVVADEQSVARSTDVAAERHEVEQITQQLPVGQGERHIEERRGHAHWTHWMKASALAGRRDVVNSIKVVVAAEWGALEAD